MDSSTAQRVVKQTFKASSDRERFRNFVNELTNGFDETKKRAWMVWGVDIATHALKGTAFDTFGKMRRPSIR